MPTRRDRRPGAAIGHVWIGLRDVAAGASWFVALGLREIFIGEAFAVLELRGGTHLLIQRKARRIKPGTEAPFDLMVDDIDAAHARCRRLGLKPSRLRAANVHRSFTVAGPEGYRLTLTSSHVGRLPV